MSYQIFHYYTGIFLIYNNLVFFMYFSSEVQIAIKLGNFKNIGIKQPCQLLMRITIYHYDQYQGKIYATPVSIVKNDTLPSNSKTLNESEINFVQNSYWSKRIRIRYQEEISQISQICLFKTKINAYDELKYKQTRIFMLVELIYAVKQQYTTICKFEGSTASLGVHAFIPIYFDQYRFSSAIDMELHSKIVGFKFMDNRELIKYIIEEQTKAKKQNNKSAHKRSKEPKEFINFIDFLSYATKKFNKEQVQNFYDLYVGDLKIELILIRNQIKTFLDNLDIKEVTLKHSTLVNKITSKIPSSPYLTKKKKENSSQKTPFEQKNNQEEKISELNLTPNALQQFILTQFNILGGIIYELWRELLNLFKSYPENKYLKLKKQKYYESLKQYYLKNNISIETMNTKKIQPSKAYLDFYERIKNETVFKITKEYLYLTKDYTNKKQVIIFVHGFQAFGLDMEAIKNYFKYKFPHIQLFISTCNENKTDNKLQELGQRFALQLKNFINGLSSTQKIKISFICHSMGSLIVRAAFPYLQILKPNFHYFISLSSPHLGYLYHSSTLIKTSLWFLNKMNNCSSMLELCFEDKSQLQDCFLYKLSEFKGFQAFKAIILVGSKDDEYVSYHSARIQVPSQYVNNQNINAKTYLRMIQNLTKSVDKKRIIRIEAQFEKKETDFNSMIGRTAHIQLLSDKHSIKIFSNLFNDIFT